jgi:hypothetical protein
MTVIAGRIDKKLSPNSYRLRQTLTLMPHTLKAVCFWMRYSYHHPDATKPGRTGKIKNKHQQNACFNIL